jgi:ketosteroid isomerase-like protein
MSRKNVESVRHGMESAEAFWGLLDEDVVWEMSLEFALPEFPNRAIGREEVIEGSRRYWGTWEEYRLDAEELIDAGASVVVVVRERGRGKGSGIPFDRRWAQVWTFSQGRIVRWELFPDRAAAVESAGLREQ